MVKRRRDRTFPKLFSIFSFVISNFPGTILSPPASFSNHHFFSFLGQDFPQFFYGKPCSGEPKAWEKGRKGCNESETEQNQRKPVSAEKPTLSHRSESCRLPWSAPFLSSRDGKMKWESNSEKNRGSPFVNRRVSESWWVLFQWNEMKMGFV